MVERDKQFELELDDVVAVDAASAAPIVKTIRALLHARLIMSLNFPRF